MSGIYLHIPFCKQACHYCDFHFSTSLKHRQPLLEAMKQELQMQKEAGWQQTVETIYFGGGTPSLLSVREIEEFIELISSIFKVVPEPEITLEANPDDLKPDIIKQLAASSVNRLSIGVQSFDEKELRWMNRAHTHKEALESLKGIQQHFPNYSLDLIYGVPGSNLDIWEANLKQALEFNPPHISSYALTVEPGTALKSFIEKGVSPDVDEAFCEDSFQMLVTVLESEGFEHYEISNFGKPGFFSKNNTAYWKGKPYLGIGPSAHSFDGRRRMWNISNNIRYTKAIAVGKPLREIETLSQRDRYNELVMMGLRTQWGVSLQQIQQTFGPTYKAYLMKQAQQYLDEHLLFMDGKRLYTTRKGKFLADGIASDLFMVNLK
ncbi:radical SAM family heme chaperone HemW [Robiginitalea sp. IMCC43444]|uniref:radical SAM family heme chaperone HemW n=1 Tax=Robiginitalea sp. IMCC43444 TaxID=3459121 RepID=UPI004042084C